MVAVVNDRSGSFSTPFCSPGLPLFDFARLVLIEEIRSWCSEFDFAITSRRGIQKQGPNMGLGPQYGFRVPGLG